MPEVADGYVQLATRVRGSTMERMKAVVAKTGRSLAEEIDHALNRHADAPPEVIVKTPPLKPATVEKPKRGRPRKA